MHGSGPLHLLAGQDSVGEDLKAVPRVGTLKQTVLTASLGKLRSKQKSTISLARLIGLLMTIVRSGP